MSNSFTFEIKTETPREELYGQVREFWSGQSVSVDAVGSDRKTWLCVLSYYFREPYQDLEVRRVVDFLFSQSTDGVLHYYRCSETAEYAVDFRSPLGVDDLFGDEYRPSLHSGIQYRYRLTRGSPSAE
jgi:hypothetical protein